MLDFSISCSKLFEVRGDLRLTSSCPGDNKVEVELALTSTDNPELLKLWLEASGSFAICVP